MFFDFNIQLNIEDCIGIAIIVIFYFKYKNAKNKKVVTPKKTFEETIVK